MFYPNSNSYFTFIQIIILRFIPIPIARLIPIPRKAGRNSTLEQPSSEFEQAGSNIRYLDGWVRLNF